MENYLNQQDAEKLGNIFYEARKKNKYSLRYVGEQTQLPFSEINRLERGLIPRPKMPMLMRLIAFYGLDADKVYSLAKRLPPGVFWKLVNNPQVWGKVLEMEV